MPLNRKTTWPKLPSLQLPTVGSIASWLKENSLLVGAWARQGFQEHGRGMVWIRTLTMAEEAGPWPWSTEACLVEPSYVTSAEAETAISNLPCKQSRLQIKRALQTYNPSADAMAWLDVANEPLVLHLKALKVAPEEALRQLARRRDEFELS